jgi:RNA polymerase sigma factor (sigma-70 family)
VTERGSEGLYSRHVHRMDGPAAASDESSAGSRDTAAMLALVARCLDGDRRAFDELMAELAPTIRAVARYMGGKQGPDWVDETVVETMVQIYRTLSSFQGTSTVRAWCSGVCVRVALGRMRSDRRRQRCLEPLTEEAASGNDPTSATEDKLLGDRVRAAALKLPLEYRLVFSLRCVVGCSYNEIADILGIPIGTVKSRMFQAKRRLQMMIAPRYWDGYYAE